MTANKDALRSAHEAWPAVFEGPFAGDFSKRDLATVALVRRYFRGPVTGNVELAEEQEDQPVGCNSVIYSPADVAMRRELGVGGGGLPPLLSVRVR